MSRFRARRWPMVRTTDNGDGGHDDDDRRQHTGAPARQRPPGRRGADDHRPDGARARSRRSSTGATCATGPTRSPARASTRSSATGWSTASACATARPSGTATATCRRRSSPTRPSTSSTRPWRSTSPRRRPTPTSSATPAGSSRSRRATSPTCSTATSTPSARPTSAACSPARSPPTRRSARSPASCSPSATRRSPPYLRYLRVSADGALVQTEEITVGGPTMMHDFNVTRNHVIFMDLPAVFDLELAMRGEMPIHWDDAYPARLGVMPRDGTDADVRWYDIDPCYVFHPMNAYEDGDADRARRRPPQPHLARLDDGLPAAAVLAVDDRHDDRQRARGAGRRPARRVPPRRRQRHRPAPPLRLHDGHPRRRLRRRSDDDAAGAILKYDRADRRSAPRSTSAAAACPASRCSSPPTAPTPRTTAT